ncbi:MAG: hypothetical protein QM650_15825 [Microlunatus sp.]
MTVPPAIEPERPAQPVERRARTWWWFGSIGTAMLLIVGLVWYAGGFRPRTDVRTDVPIGTTITTGPYALTFDHATVQKTNHFSRDQVVWEVVVYGSGRTTGDEAIAPSSLNWFMTARDPASGEALEPTQQGFGPAELTASGGSFFTPGLAPIPYRLIFQFSGDLDQPTRIDLAIWDLELRDQTLLKTGELSWSRTNYFSVYPAIPLERLPDDLK